MPTPESMADILAEMRQAVFGTPSDGPQRFPIVKEWADRIEAAANRESELLKANIARVRELEGMLGGAANTLLGCAIRQKKSEAEAANVAKLRAAVEGIEMLLGAGGDLDRKELAEECARALAAAPRNCDRFTTRDDAVREYLHLAANAKLPEDQAKSIATWLFARAPEKGGAQ